MTKKILHWLPFLLIMLLFSIGFYLTRLFLGDFDEHDHIAAGYLMMHGKLLYKDIFTHHFPFPYYWTWLFTPLWSESNPSRTISIFRLELLTYYLFIFTLCYLTMSTLKTRFLFLISIILLFFAMLMYEGNIVLSDTFVSIALMGIAWTSIPVVLGWEKMSKMHTLVLIIFASCAFWTQPFAILFFAVPALLTPRSQWQMMGIITFVLNIIPLGIFALTGQIAYFWEQGIWFNSAIYSNYYIEHLPMGTSRWSVITYALLNEWRLLTHFGTPLQIFQGITHIGLLVGIGYCFNKRKISAGILITCLMIASRLREIKIVTGAPFVYGIYPLILLGTFITLIMLTYLYQKNKYMSVIGLCALFVFSVLPTGEIIKNSLNQPYNYHVFWSYRQDRGEMLKKLSEPNEKILIYPHEVDLYYFADREPIDRFLYWFPWTNDVEKYRNERLVALKTHSPPVIDVSSLAYQKDPRYKKYFPDLLKGYIPVKKDGKATGIYLRGDLKDRMGRL